VKSGPDVFADALVPMPAPIKPGAVFPESPHRHFDCSRLKAVKKRDRARRGALRSIRERAIAPMVIALPNGRVNRIPRSGENRCKTGIPRFRHHPRRARVHIRFIANLKLPFKFDRS
jgi:hypothetical protein